VKLYEFQAKQIFAKYGITTPKGEVASNGDEAFAVSQRTGPAWVKAQVHAGGRGKAGFVQEAPTPEKARELANFMIGKQHAGLPINRVLIEQSVSENKAAEYYLAATIDRTTKRVIIMASKEGGVEIEEVAAHTPEKIIKLGVDPAYGPLDFEVRDMIAAAGFEPKAARNIAQVVKKVYQILIENDASLVEINPLIITNEGGVIAADGKFDVDDNALFRQTDLAKYREESEEDPIEAEAHRRGVTYVRLDGDIGIIGNGAGLVMTTIDLVTRAGDGKHGPANFLDIGGGAQAESVREAIEIVLMDPNVKGILFNIFGGITRGDEVAKGILAGTETMDIKVPIVVRMAGTRSEEGRRLLEGTNLVPAGGAVEAAQKIVELAGRQ
jgi:succinyl-CoA synthetase beta subunit